MSTGETEYEKVLEKTEHLLIRLHNIHAEGVSRISRKINAELKFLKSLKKVDVEKREKQMKCSNTHHLEAIVDITEQYENVTHILRPFHYHTEEGQAASVVVDVVAGNGKLWVKVIARKASALHRVWLGDGDYGDRSVVDQARKYVYVSHQHPVYFQPPLVQFVFCAGITKPIVELTELSVVVKGNVIDVGAGLSTIDEAFRHRVDSDKLETLSWQQEVSMETTKECDKLNLDITTLIALVSELTHGGCWYRFKEDVLTDQASRERQSALLPRLCTFMQDKKWFACESAVRDFNTILATIGGKNEKQRAVELLDRITIVPDQVSQRASELSESGRIKPRSKIIFGTGDRIQAITVTANTAFTRAAADQGVSFDVFHHDPRALTEGKQETAVKLSEDDLR
ncbi:UPF0415 protein C7orf25 homolog isoform X2 [Glandiceps talaboti]